MSDTTVYGVVIDRTAAASLGGQRVVRVTTGGEVNYADSATTGHAKSVLGITAGAASSGASVRVLTYGTLVDPSFSFTPLAPIYVGSSGTLTQTAPTSGFVQQVAVAVTATTIFVDLLPSLILS